MTLPDGACVEADVLAARLTRAVRLLTVAITLTTLAGLELPVLVANRDGYTRVGPQYLAFGLFALVAVGEAVTALRGRLRSPWRLPALVLVMLVSAGATATVRPGRLLGIPHWSFGMVGWVLVLLTFGEPVALFAALLATHWLVTLGQVALGGGAAPTLAGVLNQAMLAAVFQLSAVVFAIALRRTAVTTANAWSAGERVRTSAAVAGSLHDDRVERYAALAVTALPLLAGLGSGELDPGDESVRRSCAIEAARMRRLFADTDPVPDPLVQHIRACVELAERRGVRVVFAECGPHRAVPRPVRLALTEAAAVALATARERVRVTLVRTADAVAVSVVSDAASPAPAAVTEPRGDPDRGVIVSSVVLGEQLRIVSVWTHDGRGTG
ncbi:MAG TPA: hypothetical protein VJT31_07420 [Rugosimonospora sp.]|nr:hypothetical protein [Rugosimonospora sp.]